MYKISVYQDILYYFGHQRIGGVKGVKGLTPRSPR